MGGIGGDGRGCEAVTCIEGDCREVLRGMADGSVHCCITSPPYWGQRDYGTATWIGGDAECSHFKLMGGTSSQGLGKSPEASAANVERSSVPFRTMCGHCGAVREDAGIGMEPTLDEYVANLVGVFRDVRSTWR